MNRMRNPENLVNPVQRKQPPVLFARGGIPVILWRKPSAISQIAEG